MAKILITSGGTKIPLDRVRNITNMSRGTFGSKIAAEALKAGHDVIFLRAKDSKSPFTPDIDFRNQKWRVALAEALLLDFNYRDKYLEYRYSTFDDYEDALITQLDDHKPDITILAAAVSDYGVENYVDGKVRSGDGLTIKMKPLPKLIGRIKEWCPTTKLVGFKLLVDSTDEELIAAAKKSVLENGCELVVANDLRDIKNNNHRITFVRHKPSYERDDGWEITSIATSDSGSDDSNYLAREVVRRAVAL